MPQRRIRRRELQCALSGRQAIARSLFDLSAKFEVTGKARGDLRRLAVIEAFKHRPDLFVKIASLARR